MNADYANFADTAGILGFRGRSADAANARVWKERLLRNVAAALYQRRSPPQMGLLVLWSGAAQVLGIIFLQCRRLSSFGKDEQSTTESRYETRFPSIPGGYMCRAGAGAQSRCGRSDRLFPRTWSGS